MMDTKTLDLDVPTLTAFGLAVRDTLLYQLLLRGACLRGDSLFWFCPCCSPSERSNLLFEYDLRLSMGFCHACLRTLSGRDLLLHLRVDTDPVNLVKDWLKDQEHLERQVRRMLEANTLIDHYNNLLSYGIGPEEAVSE